MINYKKTHPKKILYNQNKVFKVIRVVCFY